MENIYYIVRTDKAAMMFNYNQLKRYLRHHDSDKIDPIIFRVDKRENEEVPNNDQYFDN